MLSGAENHPLPDPYPYPNPNQVLSGAENHPLPDPSREIMPAAADSRVLFWSQVSDSL